MDLISDDVIVFFKDNIGRNGDIFENIYISSQDVLLFLQANNPDESHTAEFR